MPIIHESGSSAHEGQPVEQDGAILQVEGLQFSYPDGRQALHGVTFSLAPGEKVGLVGPNGSGKSTLLLNLLGLLEGDGDIQVAGLPATEENFPRIRAMAGLVFQNPDDQLFSPTVHEDVAYGPLYMGLPEAEIKERIDEALAQVGMSAYDDRLSHYLSQGEKKRIAIATVLAMHPKLLLLDEPTAGLDPRARRQLIQLLADLPVSMLVATHDLRMVQELLPHTIILDEGQVVAEGGTEKLLNDEALLRQHGLEI